MKTQRSRVRKTKSINEQLDVRVLKKKSINLLLDFLFHSLFFLFPSILAIRKKNGGIKWMIRVDFIFIFILCWISQLVYSQRSPTAKIEWDGKSHLSNVIHFTFILITFNFLLFYNTFDIAEIMGFVCIFFFLLLLFFFVQFTFLLTCVLVFWPISSCKLILQK